MDALIIALGENKAMEDLNCRCSTPMMPLVDRPFIQHVVEQIAAHGVKDFHFFLNHLPESIEAYLGNGERWGCRFNYHLVRDVSVLGRMMRCVSFGDGPVLLASGEQFPVLAEMGDHLFSASSGMAVLNYQGNWTGWARMDTSILGQCPDVDMPESFDAWIQSLATPENIVEAEYCMDFRSYDGMMKAHDWALTKHVPGMLLSAREMDPGIWISRNVRLHPLARLVPPVYIGEDCRVESGVNLGPGVVVGSRSIIDAGTVAENAVIFPGTYVGEALELKDAIIDRNCLVNVRLESGTLIRDSFILYSAEGARVKNGVYRFMERVVAAILLITLWPLPLVLSVLAFMRGGKWQAFDAVSTPAEQHASLWRTFSIHHIVISPTDAPSSCGHLFRVCGWFIPGLLRVVLGDLSLVGMPARGRKELFALSESWRNMCLSTKSGLISEAEVAGAGDSLDLQYTADAFYATRAGFRHDIRLFVKYLMGAGRSLPGPAEEGMNRDQ